MTTANSVVHRRTAPTVPGCRQTPAHRDEWTSVAAVPDGVWFTQASNPDRKGSAWRRDGRASYLFRYTPGAEPHRHMPATQVDQYGPFIAAVDQ